MIKNNNTDKNISVNVNDDYKKLKRQRFFKYIKSQLLFGLFKIIVFGGLIVTILIVSGNLYDRVTKYKLARSDNYHKSDHNYLYSRTIGTPSRSEIELKLALDYNNLNNVSLYELSRELLDYVATLIDEFKFAQAAGCRVYLDDSPRSFAFFDDYFDTKDLYLFNNSASYRLRRRWSSYNRYLSYHFIPWSKLFYPTRIEIQAKTGYKKHVLASSELAVDETRFEFRQSASPFNEGMNLPDTKDLTLNRLYNYVKTGNFNGYMIYPYKSILDYMKLTNKHNKINKFNFRTKNYDLDLFNSLTVLSKRYRFHINCKHSLGSGSNPEHLFIISLDHVVCMSQCCETEQIIEIEIERERNSSTTIDNLFAIKNESRFNKNHVAKIAFDYVSFAKKAYDHDHKLINSGVRSFIESRMIKILPTTNKYERFVCKNKKYNLANNN